MAAEEQRAAAAAEEQAAAAAEEPAAAAEEQAAAAEEQAAAAEEQPAQLNGAAAVKICTRQQSIRQVVTHAEPLPLIGCQTKRSPHLTQRQLHRC